jgi:hypothetical protein
VDEIVLRSMVKWPDVPAVYGWLALDRRGQWRIKAPAGGFERIANVALGEFIGRNYAADDAGRWYFQNGPQRVYISLDYTPWIYRLDGAGVGFVAHTGAATRRVDAAFLDDAGALLLHTELGVGAVLDRDLLAFVERFGDFSAIVERVSLGEPTKLILQGNSVPLAAIRAADVPARFAFVPRPRPRPGEPDC